MRAHKGQRKQAAHAHCEASYNKPLYKFGTIEDIAVCVSDAEQLAGSWRRVPSVTTGGKSFFWLGKFPGRTVALVWDRSAEGWRMHYGPNFDLRGGEVFPGIAEAKRDAQQFALGYPLQPYERA
jgi:hypothetical protein